MKVSFYHKHTLLHTLSHTHTWLSDATLEGGFNLMCLMLTLVARSTHTLSH